MASRFTKMAFSNKKIIKLSVKSGQCKEKIGDKEKKCVVETGKLKDGKFQTFSIPLGFHGKQSLGYINVEYWGNRELKEGMLIRKGQYYLKQTVGEKKNANFTTEKRRKHVLVLLNFDCLMPDEKYEDKAGYEAEHSAEVVNTDLNRIDQEPEETIKISDME